MIFVWTLLLMVWSLCPIKVEGLAKKVKSSGVFKKVTYFIVYIIMNKLLDRLIDGTSSLGKL
jgi:hypothetical protein